MACDSNKQDDVEVSLPLAVLCRLLRERSLHACEIHCLNARARAATHYAIKASITANPNRPVRISRTRKNNRA